MNTALLVRLAEIAVGVVVLGILLRRFGRLLPRQNGSPFEAAMERTNQPAPELDEFKSIRRAVDGARFSGFDAHFTLRPLLRELAAQRLWLRRGIRLDAQPELASAALGVEAFAFVREGRPAPRNYRRPVISLEAVERIVKALESI
jgi:hypothetical protein